MISALVLAAGESKRMGETKQLLEWQGKPILQHILDTLSDSAVDEVILVLGHEAGRISSKVSGEKIKIIINPDYKEGMSTSLRHGLRAMDEKAEAFLVVLGDQPGVGKEIIDRLIQSFHEFGSKKDIVLPTYRGRRGHPVLFSRRYVEEALKLKGDVGARQVLLGHPEEILAVEVNTDAILSDIDTPQDYLNQEERDLAEE